MGTMQCSRETRSLSISKLFINSTKTTNLWSQHFFVLAYGSAPASKSVLSSVLIFHLKLFQLIAHAPTCSCMHGSHVYVYVHGYTNCAYLHLVVPSHLLYCLSTVLYYSFSRWAYTRVYLIKAWVCSGTPLNEHP